MKKLICCLFFFLIVNLSYSQEFIPYYGTVVEQCSQDNITTNLEQFEALGVKRRGTTALQNTLNWLKNKYLSYGYTASQIQEDSYTYQGSSAVCKNLIVTKIGTVYPNTFVIICGHYDSITGTGTNDNGSGVACILETARLLNNIPTEYSIKFINFSGEEDGLRGSEHFVSSIVNATTPKMDIRVVFNLDEVGGVAGLDNDTITCEKDLSNSPSTNNAASTIITDELIACVQLYSPLNTYLSYAYASDYMSFEDNGEIITGLFETNETTHKHTDTDLLENMDPVYNYNVAKATIGATMHFATAATSVLATEDLNNEFQISFFPNPTKEYLYINKGQLKEDYSFSLIDVNGKVVFSKQFVNSKLLENITVSQYSKGVYLAVVEAGKERFTKTIVFK
jgi:aminopeptidase YwaD